MDPSDGSMWSRRRPSYNSRERGRRSGRSQSHRQAYSSSVTLLASTSTLSPRSTSVRTAARKACASRAVANVIGARCSTPRSPPRPVWHSTGTQAGPERFRGVAPVRGQRKQVERVTRIELAFSAWEADVLPLNYTRAPAHPRTRAPAHPRAEPGSVSARVRRRGISRFGPVGRTESICHRRGLVTFGHSTTTVSLKSRAASRSPDDARPVRRGAAVLERPTAVSVQRGLCRVRHGRSGRDLLLLNVAVVGEVDARRRRRYHAVPPSAPGTSRPLDQPGGHVSSMRPRPRSRGTRTTGRARPRLHTTGPRNHVRERRA